MPRFYFDARAGSRFAQDLKGMEFPDLDAAEREARKAVIGLAREFLPKGDARKVKLEVRNERGERVLTIRVTMDIERSAQATEPSRA
jgi:hypothetical protein